MRNKTGETRNHFESGDLKKQLELTKKIACLKGLMDEWLNLVSQPKKISHGCLAAQDSNPASITGGVIDSVQCKLRASEVQNTASTQTELTEAGFINIEHAADASTNHQDSENQCHMLARGGEDSIIKTDGDTFAVKYIGGYIQVETDTENAASLANVKKTIGINKTER
uniref:Variant surface glycoprotein n=1 Tax=Trypanosoma brucei TaxID=5691 RepID=A0A1V0FYM7_9TRYP|nr:variant surface glycoprotein [Trypanosoma brucei]